MACLLSWSFTVPLRPSPIISLNKNKEVHRLDFALDRLSSTAAIRTAQRILGSRSSNKLVKGSCQQCLMSCTRFLHGTHSYNLDVDYCIEIVIFGYWVGPDADDGWGFVEAIINQTN